MRFTRFLKHYVYFEEKLIEYKENDLKWAWTDGNKKGLQARRIKDNVLVFRWYPNQKQFFERFIFPEDAYEFCIEPQRLAIFCIIRGGTAFPT